MGASILCVGARPCLALSKKDLLNAGRRMASPLHIMAIFVIGNAASAQDSCVFAEAKTANSGRQYLLMHGDHCKPDFELVRPKRDDANILLCIPAAFTGTYGGICGFYASHGVLGNQNRLDKKIGGGIELAGGSARIFDTGRGASLSPEFGEKLKTQKESFFQQFQIVKSGKAEGFSDRSSCQRRCIATMNDGRLFVIESADSVTFDEFGNDLVNLGVQDAIYTDMGPWSEGWYRDAKGALVTIGNSRSMTGKQSNWFVLRK